MQKLFVFLLSIVTVNFAYADYTTQDIINGCDIDILLPASNTAKMLAMFETDKYTCNAGYYLPADNLECATCLSGYICDGGTYEYNEANDQGIKYNTIISEEIVNGCDINLLGYTGKVAAIFEPNQYTCNTGYYMPANTDGCVICPENSYCSGGTYTFNETISQGIESCPNNWYSPTGMSSVAQCGRILHVGDSVIYLRSEKQTTPSLNVKIGNDIYYGNMTTNDIPMNINTERKLKIRFNDTAYSVYDDTVQP